MVVPEFSLLAFTDAKPGATLIAIRHVGVSSSKRCPLLTSLIGPVVAGCQIQICLPANSVWISSCFWMSCNKWHAGLFGSPALAPQTRSRRPRNCVPLAPGTLSPQQTPRIVFRPPPPTHAAGPLIFPQIRQIPESKDERVLYLAPSANSVSPSRLHFCVLIRFTEEGPEGQNKEPSVAPVCSTSHNPSSEIPLFAFQPQPSPSLLTLVLFLWYCRGSICSSFQRHLKRHALRSIVIRASNFVRGGPYL